MWPFVVLGAVFLLAIVVIVAVLWEDRRDSRSSRSAVPWRSRRRAVAATLEVATARTTTAPTASARPSEQGSFADRVVGPTAGAIGAVVGRLSPPGYVESVRRRLTIAGRGRQLDTNKFLAGRVATIALIPIAFIGIELTHLSKLYRLMAFLVALLLLVLGPEARLNREAEARQNKMRRDLPALVDLLMISVEAGLGFDQALVRAVAAVPGPLSEEFGRFLGEVRMGADRAESLEAIDIRTDMPELRSFLMALIQAETFGVSIGGILKAQAVDIRIAHRQHVQEQAQKAPVKMLFPLVFCVLPALFIVVIGPAGIQIYDEIVKQHVL
jgi:tight adherence protein C